MGYLTKMNGESGQNGFSTVGLSILGQAPRGGLIYNNLNNHYFYRTPLNPPFSRGEAKRTIHTQSLKPRPTLRL